MVSFLSKNEIIKILRLHSVVPGSNPLSAFEKVLVPQKLVSKQLLAYSIKEKMYDQKNVYTSRFVRVILAQGPC